jgi:hypothetical protein
MGFVVLSDLQPEEELGRPDPSTSGWLLSHRPLLGIEFSKNKLFQRVILYLVNSQN